MMKTTTTVRLTKIIKHIYKTVMRMTANKKEISKSAKEINKQKLASHPFLSPRTLETKTNKKQ